MILFKIERVYKIESADRKNDYENWKTIGRHIWSNIRGKRKVIQEE